MDRTCPVRCGCDSARLVCSDRLCFDLFGLGANNAYADCSNPYSTDDEVDSFCLWHRYSCATYYNLNTAQLLPGFCFSSDPTCVGTTVPVQCELDDNICASTGDTRCTCAADSSMPAQDTSVLIVTDIVYGQGENGVPYIPPLDSNGNSLPIFEPSNDPIRLPKPLRFPDPNGVCATQFWAGCDCPPQSWQPASMPFQSCTHQNASGYCDPDGYSFEYTGASFNNLTLGDTLYFTWPSNDYPTAALSAQIGIKGLVCSAQSKLLKCDCSFSYLVSITDPAPGNTSGVPLTICISTTRNCRLWTTPSANITLECNWSN